MNDIKEDARVYALKMTHLIAEISETLFPELFFQNHCSIFNWGSLEKSE